MNRQILIAPNAFKHSLGAIDVAKTIKYSLMTLDSALSLELLPIADGGSGTIDILKFSFPSSKFINVKAHDPLMREINCNWLLLNETTAVIELSKVSGIELLLKSELNPLWASTYGTGELILSALEHGCKKIIISLGGSATVEGGIGLLEAIGVKFEDKKGSKVKPGGGFLNSIQKISTANLDNRLKNCELHVLCDVNIPLVGDKGAVHKFAAQKGANEGEKVVLEEGMKHYAKIAKQFTGNGFEFESMTGSAGGVAYSLKTFLNAKLFSGFLYLSNLISLDEKIKNSDLIVTGEGSLDEQSLMGKGVIELAKIAKKYSKKVIALCGTYDNNINWHQHCIEEVIEIKSENISLEESIQNVKELIPLAIKNNSRMFINY